MKKRFGLVVVLVVMAVGFLLTGKVSADVQNFVITDFQADYYLSKDSPHGSLSVKEKIAVDFHDYNHGILRAIPDSYGSHPLKLKLGATSSPSGAPAQYTIYESGGNKVMRIGDPDRTVTGQQSYVLNYSLQNVITYYADHDEFFWDINGDQWPQTFNRVTARIHIPADLSNQLQNRLRCYTGSFGSLAQNCTITRTVEGSGSLITAKAKDLGPYQTLSVVAAFNKGTFAPYTWHDTLAEHIGDIIISLLALAVLALAFKHWWYKGRDPKGYGIIVPQYGPPKGVGILEAGLLQDYRLDNKDITAVIIDLAIRGYVTITEQDQKLLFLKTGTKTTLTLNKTDSSKLKDYELLLLTTLFDDSLESGKTISLGKYQSGMQSTIKKIGKESFDRLTKQGLYDSNPQSAKWGLITLYILIVGLLIFIGFKAHAYISGVVSIVVLAIILILAVHMPRRSKQGALYNDDLKGLRLYLNTAEKDRIKFLQSPNAKYAENAAEPKRTVKLFEKLLPFAIIFGVEKQWAKQFNDLYTQPPDWYHGNWATFNAVALTNHISGTTASAFSSTFSPPSSSGGSGFSGGGSGGGGGGGGGGGW